MDAQQITEMTLSAWDEEQREEPEAELEAEPETEPPAETDEPDEPETEQEEEPAEEPEESEQEEPESPEDEPEDEPDDEPSFRSDNPQVQAYLAKYQGDPEKALTAAVHLQQVLGRQGQEKAVLGRRVEELEHELEQMRAFGPGAVLSPEQRTWAAQAVESDNPAAYVQQAIQSNEFGVARAICDQWAEESPYEAARAAQLIDAHEWRAQQQQQVEATPEFDRVALMGVLEENFPEMPQYEQQMLQTMQALGDAHPLVEDAHSADPYTVARAVIGIYEIARAQTASVKTARTKLKRDGRQAADDARARAVVSSAQANPSPSETPRSKALMPGLTLDELDAAWGSK